MTREGDLVLVVDDEAEMRKFIARLSPPNGYRILEASAGSEALISRATIPRSSCSTWDA